jgi:hypothetical protein
LNLTRSRAACKIGSLSCSSKHEGVVCPSDDAAESCRRCVVVGARQGATVGRPGAVVDRPGSAGDRQGATIDHTSAATDRTGAVGDRQGAPITVRVLRPTVWVLPPTLKMSPPTVEVPLPSAEKTLATRGVDHEGHQSRRWIFTPAPQWAPTVMIYDNYLE